MTMTQGDLASAGGSVQGEADLPSLDGDYELDGQAVVSFAENGHVLLRGLASPAEVAAYQPVISAAAFGHSRETRALAERDTYGKAFLQVGNLWKVDEGVARFVLARRFARVAAQLLGVPGVRLYHDQALFKEAGGGITPWHQDRVYWPFEPDAGTITMWMPLVDVEEDMGGMAFASGSHKVGGLSQLLISDESQAYYDALVANGTFPVSEPVPMRAGDATFHAGWTLHRAHPNTGSVTREVMTVIYYADGSTVAVDPWPTQKNDLAKFFPAVKPGEVAVSDLTPLVYSSVV